jgi:hypothetical protein
MIKNLKNGKQPEKLWEKTIQHVKVQRTKKSHVK